MRGRNTLRLALVLLVSACVPSVLGAESDAGKTGATTPAAQPQPAAQKSAASQKKPAAAKKKTLARTEAEVSGFTSETSDLLSGRINLIRVFGSRQWSIRTGYSANKTRTYGKNSVSETDIGTFTLDGQHRWDRRGGYSFVSAVANIRRRSPHSSVYADKSGYYMVAAGFGKTVMPGIEAELALAKINRYDDEDERLTPVYALRLRRDLTESVVLDGNSHFVEPFSEDPLVDTRANLTYKFTPTLSLRLTYVADNMLRPIQSKVGWDKSFRISLVFASVKS